MPNTTIESGGQRSVRFRQRGAMMPAIRAHTDAIPIPLFLKINTKMEKRFPPNYIILIFNHLKLCLATATHNFKWVKILLYLFKNIQN